MKFGNKNRQVLSCFVFSTREYFPKLSECLPEFQGHLFLTRNPSELELTRFAESGGTLGAMQIWEMAHDGLGSERVKKCRNKLS